MSNEWPERLLYFKSRRLGRGLAIEALFQHGDQPIKFDAYLHDGEREFEANISAASQGMADYWNAETLLAACFNSGCLEPEHKHHTKEIKQLQMDCDTLSEDSNWYDIQ